MTELKIFKVEEPERIKWVLKCKKTYRADNGNVAFIEGKRYPWRRASYCESDYTGCEIVLTGEHGDCYLNTVELCEYFEGVYTSSVTKQGVAIAEDHYTAAIKELTDAILGLLGEEETPHEGYQDYMLMDDDINAAIRLAKKHKKLIEGKS